jgi:hypothetical protein
LLIPKKGETIYLTPILNFLAGGIGRQILDALREADGSVPVDGIGLYACMSEQDHTCGKSG